MKVNIIVYKQNEQYLAETALLGGIREVDARNQTIIYRLKIQILKRIISYNTKILNLIRLFLMFKINLI
jgi:hypothetical protein